MRAINTFHLKFTFGRSPIKNPSWKIPIPGTFPLPLFAHRNELLEYFLHGHWIDPSLNRLVKNSAQHFRSPALIMDRHTCMDLNFSNLSCKILPVCNEPDDLFVSLCDLCPYGFERHMIYMSECSHKRVYPSPDTKADIKRTPYLIR